MPWLELRMREGGVGGADAAGDRGALAGVARQRRRAGERSNTGVASASYGRVEITSA
jgi:hypothetical protein